MSDQRAKFLELAEARLETILDKVRVFSNLANPGYPWETPEILAYFDRIDAGLQEARHRFEKNKQWISPVSAAAPASDDPGPPVVPSAGPSPALLELLRKSPDPNRVYTVTEHMQLAEIDARPLLDRLAASDAVIARLEAELAIAKGRKHDAAAA